MKTFIAVIALTLLVLPMLLGIRFVRRLPKSDATDRVQDVTNFEADG